MLGFVALGMPKSAFAVAWPSVASELGRSLAELGTVLAVYIAATVVTTLASGAVAARIGAGPALAAGAAAGAAALVGYATAPSWGVLLLSAAALGAAGGLLDAGVNAHVAVRHGVRAMGVLHAAFGVGATLGPLVLTLILGGGHGWRLAYVLFLVFQTGLAMLFFATRSQWGTRPDQPERQRRIERSRLLAVTLGAFALYTGLELAAGQWTFTLFTEGRGLDERVAGLAVSGFWAGITASRLALGAVGHRASPVRVLRMATLAATAGALLVWWSPQPWVGPTALIVTGLALGPVFPLLTLLTPDRFGVPSAPSVIGYQIASANLGAALIPGGIGWAVGALGLTVVGPVLASAALALATATELTRRASAG